MHIANKMKTRFLKPSILLPVGKHVVSPTFLRILIAEKEKKYHGLIISNLDSLDKMNFKAVDKISSKKFSREQSNYNIP